MLDKSKVPQKIHTYTDTLAGSGNNNKIETKGNRPQCLLRMQIKSRPIVYNIYEKAEVLVILLIFAVTFLLQDDFFLVVTPRA
jgi:hypothetical protein